MIPWSLSLGERVSEEFFFSTFSHLVSKASNENEQWLNNLMYNTGLLKEHFCKILSKFLKWIGSKCHFSISPIVSLWKI